MRNITLLACCISFLFSANAQEVNQGMPSVVKNRVIKMDFFAPLTGNLTFGYEQPLLNGITFSGDFGIIGASAIPLPNHEAGIFVRTGLKLYYSPDYVMEGMKRYNDFQGGYFNPEIVYSGFGFDYNSFNPTSGAYSTRRGSNHSFALMLRFGKQWVMAKTFSIELYSGIGYGWSYISVPGYSNGYGSLSDANTLVPNKFSHLQVSNDFPLAFDAGFTLGILLK